MKEYWNDNYDFHNRISVVLMNLSNKINKDSENFIVFEAQIIRKGQYQNFQDLYVKLYSTRVSELVEHALNIS